MSVWIQEPTQRQLRQDWAGDIIGPVCGYCGGTADEHCRMSHAGDIVDPRSPEENDGQPQYWHPDPRELGGGFWDDVPYVHHPEPTQPVGDDY